MSAPGIERPDAREAPRGDELYPGLVVHDDRVCGSITVGHSRLPVWAIPTRYALAENWDYAPTEYGVTDDALSDFHHALFNQARRDIGRALLMLADSDRREDKTGKPYGGKQFAAKLAAAFRAAADYVEDDYARNTTAPAAVAGADSSPRAPGGSVTEESQ